MTTLQTTNRACLPLGKRGAFEGVARRPWMAGGTGTDDAQSTTANTAHHQPQRWVEKVDRSIKGSDTPHVPDGNTGTQHHHQNPNRHLPLAFTPAI